MSQPKVHQPPRVRDDEAKDSEEAVIPVWLHMIVEPELDHSKHNDDCVRQVVQPGRIIEFQLLWEDEFPIKDVKPPEKG